MAKTQISDSELQQTLDYLCGQLDCKEIQPGGSCFWPDTVRDHASYAIDLNFRVDFECDPSYAILVASDPSYGACVYP
ncbi:hypothetical protein R6Q59_012761 [Mikania micrantha]